jgi:hypothetical protein
MYLFADDAKISKNIKTEADKLKLQKGLDDLVAWSNMWLLSLNILKCITLIIRKHGISTNAYYITTKENRYKLENVDKTKDLGILVDNRLNFDEHISEKIKKANCMLGLIKRNFKSMDEFTFINLYKTLVRSHLEYAACVWSPYKKYLIDAIEKIQRKATKMMPKLKDKPYNERLQILKLQSLTYRRHRGDMIQTYKILTGKYDKSVIPNLKLNDSNITRGNSLKLTVHRSKHELRKHSFCMRIPSIWNSLHNSVIQAKSINSFKYMLDKFWEKQDILYNYKAPLQVTRTIY